MPLCNWLLCVGPYTCMCPLSLSYLGSDSAKKFAFSCLKNTKKFSPRRGGASGRRGHAPQGRRGPEISVCRIAGHPDAEDSHVCLGPRPGFRGSGSAMPGPAGSRGSRFRFHGPERRWPLVGVTVRFQVPVPAAAGGSRFRRPCERILPLSNSRARVVVCMNE